MYCVMCFKDYSVGIIFAFSMKIEILKKHIPKKMRPVNSLLELKTIDV